MKITKKTRLLARVPIAQTSDGTIKVYAAHDNGQSEAFTYGHEWLVDGVGFKGTDGGFRVGQVLVFPEGTHKDGQMLTFESNEDGTRLTLGKSGMADEIPAGVYPDAVIGVMATKGPDMEGLEIPVKLVVE